MEQPLPTTPARDPRGPVGPTDWSRVSVPGGGGPGSRFGVGEIFSQSFRIWWRDLPAYAFLAVVAAVPAAWGTYSLYGQHPELLRPDRSLNPLELLARIYGGYGAYWFAAGVLLAIETGAVIHAAVRRLGAERAGLGEMISVGLQRSFAMFGMLVLVLLATVASVCTVVVPFLLASGWAAAAPAVAVERAGPIRALRRSWGLTQGHRWKILGGVVLVYLTCAVPLLLLHFALTGGFLSAPGPGTTLEEIQALALPMAIYQLASGIFGTPIAVASAVIHHGLRIVKEGGDPAHLANVFE
jgi:hypothetical protein